MTLTPATVQTIRRLGRGAHPREDPSANYSWDQGGAAADQRRAARTGMAFEMLSAGTPLMEGGDEFLRTIQCNSNAYNLDSPGNWLNYSWSTDQSNFYNFAQRIIAFRMAHPALRPVTWYTSESGGLVRTQRGCCRCTRLLEQCEQLCHRLHNQRFFLRRHQLDVHRL
jgi:pullulanase/glycogen debranching enzyme